MLVIDSSALLSVLLPDEAGRDLEALFSEHDDVVAPALLWVEVRNILLTSERRGRLPQGSAEAICEQIDGLDIVLDHLPRSAALLKLARTYRLTAYDALYLDLALHLDAELATLDEELAAAAQDAGVRLAFEAPPTVTS